MTVKLRTSPLVSVVNHGWPFRGGAVRCKPAAAEQGFRAAFGIVRLVRPFGANRLEAAAARAIEIGTPTYGSVRSILDNKLDRQPSQRPPANAVPLLHPNIRGPAPFTLLAVLVDPAGRTGRLLSCPRSRSDCLGQRKSWMSGKTPSSCAKSSVGLATWSAQNCAAPWKASVDCWSSAGMSLND